MPALTKLRESSRLTAVAMFVMAIMLVAGCAQEPSTASIGADHSALTSTLTVDATDLSDQPLWLVGTSVFNSSTVQTVELEPGSYDLMQYYTGIDVGHFTVNFDGTVNYDQSLESVFAGRGTNVLVVHGLSLTINASALTQQLLWLHGDWVFPSSGVQHMKLVAGTYQLQQYETGPANSIGYFTLNADGTISYDQSFDAVFSGRGTNQLSLHGLSISLDARAIPRQRLWIPGLGVFDSEAVQTFEILGGRYNVVRYDTENGVVGTFVVTPDGAIDYDATLDGVFGGRGTPTLDIQPPLPISACGVIGPGEGLRPGQSVSSCNNNFTLSMDADGRLLYLIDHIPLVQLAVMAGDNQLVMQEDGNLVVTSLGGTGTLPPGSIIWTSNTAGFLGARVVFQEDGNLTIAQGEQQLWSTHTPQRLRRATVFQANAGDAQRFLFPDGSSRGAPSSSIAGALYVDGATSAQSTSESGAEVWIFSEDPSVHLLPGRSAGAMRGRFFNTVDNFWYGAEPRPFVGYYAAKLPYTVQDGEYQTVDLSTWDAPIRMVRNYDNGMCYAKADFSTFVQKFGEELRGELRKQCISNDLFHQVTIRADLGPEFRMRPYFPYLGTDPWDEVAWGVDVGSYDYCTLEFRVVVQMTHELIVNHVQSLTGDATPGSRVNVANFELLRGAEIPQVHAPDSGWPYNDLVVDGLRSKVPKSVGAGINARFVLPDVATILGNVGLLTQNPPQTIPKERLSLCTRDSDCSSAPLSPDDGCFFPNPEIGERLSETFVADDVNGKLHDEGKGVCVTRLQPKRVNIAPDGVRVVLAEDIQDQQMDLLRLLASVPNSPIVCQSIAPSATNPASVQKLGPVVVGYTGYLP